MITNSADTVVALPFLMVPPSLAGCSSSSTTIARQKGRLGGVKHSHFDPLTDSLDSLDAALIFGKAYRIRKSGGTCNDKRRGTKRSKYFSSSSSCWTMPNTSPKPRATRSSCRDRLSPTRHCSPLRRDTSDNGIFQISSSTLADNHRDISRRNSPLHQSSRFILPVRKQQQYFRRSIQTRHDVEMQSDAMIVEDYHHNRNPQDHLKQLLIERGYDTTAYRAKDTAFYNRPTEWQKACFGPALVQAIKDGNVEQLRELMAHLSPNPCNNKGESLWHMVCRRGNMELLQVLLEHKYTLDLCQAVDEHGRTVLHDACWAAKPAIDIVQVLLHRNPLLLFLKDSSNNTPLSYIPAQQWPEWLQFLSRYVDDWFPSASNSFTAQYQKAFSLIHKPPNFLPLEEHPLISLQAASAIASGKTNIILEWDDSCSDDDGADCSTASFFSRFDQSDGISRNDEVRLGKVEMISDTDELSTSEADGSEDDDLGAFQPFAAIPNVAHTPRSMPGMVL